MGTRQMRRRDTRLLSDSEARTTGWMGDLEESLSQSHSSGSFIHSCLPEAGLPGCPCRAPLLATSHLRAARPWCPGAGWRWCGGRGLWWCAGARGPGCMVPGCDGACGSDAGGPTAWWCQAALLQQISEKGPSGSTTAPLHRALPSQEFVF